MPTHERLTGEAFRRVMQAEGVTEFVCGGSLGYPALALPAREATWDCRGLSNARDRLQHPVAQHCETNVVTKQVRTCEAPSALGENPRTLPILQPTDSTEDRSEH